MNNICYERGIKIWRQNFEFKDCFLRTCGIVAEFVLKLKFSVEAYLQPDLRFRFIMDSYCGVGLVFLIVKRDIVY